MEKHKNWKFVSNANAVDSGLNDAGIETFSADSVKAMVREVIQNSIDQKDKYITESVKVEFDYFEILKDEFPNGSEFENILSKCIESNKNNLVVGSFFKQAVEKMNGKIRVLRISDFNTTGLQGAETGEKGTPWFNLIKGSGSSDKNGLSGGSFGIGKSAPFACSDLRTVMYASKTGNIYSNIGVARLVSFDGDEGRTIGTGFYTDSQKLNAMLNQYSLNGFNRNINGTDIYILGFQDCDNLDQIIKEAVLSNFFVSIFKGILTVKLNSGEINKESVGKLIAGLDDKDYKNLKNYYNLLIKSQNGDEKGTNGIVKIVLNSEEYGKKYGIKDAECTLLLMQDENLNRRVLMTRQPGMSLFEKGNFSSSISFTAILMISGNTMNEIFRTMEMPAHDAWEPKRCKVDTQKYQKAYSELIKYLRDKIIDCFGRTKEDAISAYGMEAFFTNPEDKDGKNRVKVLNPKATTSIKKEIQTINKKKERVGGEGGTFTGTNPNPNPNPKPRVESEKFKLVYLKKRLICLNAQNGEYELRFVAPKKKKKVKLEFIGIGEQSNYNLNIIKAEKLSDEKAININENNIIVENVNAKEIIRLRFNIDFNQPCMMEVKYYEA